MNFDFAKVCGKHIAIYEAYYKQIDPKATGAIEAMTAAKFLKKSGLSDVVLSRVWDSSDPQGKGFLDKPGFFVALKLVSLAQAGQVINTSNIYTETVNPPKVGDLPKVMPPRIQTVPLSSGGVATGDWSIGVIERLKYEQIFESLKPENGMLAGNTVKGVLLDSKLPMDTLGQIWDLADQDKDGNLDKHEFIVAMHLVSQTLEKRTVPNVLPPELRKPVKMAGGVPPVKPAPPHATAAISTMPRAPSGEGFGDGGFVANFPKDIAPPPAIPPLPAMTRVPPVGGAAPVLISTDPLIPIGAPPSVTANADWVVTPAELKRFEIMFRDSDRDKDGLVSGLEVKGVFLQSGVKQQCLAHIWALCDTNQSGKLTLEQFALAMWMVERKQKGLEPPQVLTANMVPPSMRGIIAGVDVQPQMEPKPTYSNPELEMIANEIEELAKERRALETEIAQKEADIRIKNGEVRSLQSELDTLSATLKQLENQRGEAQKRLDDLQAQVNKIREQCQKQEETINEQEGELNAKRSELQKLKDEEAALQKEYDDNNKELQKLTKHLQNTQLQISSVRSMVTELLETQRQMTDALLMCRAAIENQDADLTTEYQLKIEPNFDDARKVLEKKIEEPKDDPFDEQSSGNNANKNTNGFATNGFANDPFTGGSNISNSISPRGGFDDSFNTISGFDSGFDAFGSASQQKDPFGADTFSASKSNAITPEPGKDDFGSDPFAALHAPTGQGQVLSPNVQKSGPPPRPESPSPALPPKKSKVPPPRPAPPRPVQAPTARPQTDAFGGGIGSGTGTFADFADFDNKQTNIPFIQNTITTKTTAALNAFSTTNIKATTQTTAKTTNTSLDTFTSNSNDNNSLFDAFNAFGESLSFDALSTTHSASSTTLVPGSSGTFATAATTSTANITKTDDDNFFKHPSTTITQQSVGSHATQYATTAAVISGPTDFKDDPFKDYRYEDPFNIKDPFGDEDDADEETESEPTKIFNSASSLEDLASAKKVVTPLSNDFLQQFDDFTLSASPVPSQKSAASVATLGKASNTSRSNTPGVKSSSNNLLADNFADFDAFSSKSSSSSALNLKSTSTNVLSKNDNFFDAFNDNFNVGSNVTADEATKDSSKVSSNAALDAFGILSNANNNKSNSNSNSNINTMNSNSNSSGAESSNSFSKYSKFFDDDFNDNNFASFDAFGADATVATMATANSSKDVNINFGLNNNTSSSSNNNKVTDKFDAFADDTDFAADFGQAMNNSKNVINSLENTFDAAMVSNKLQKVQNQTILNKQLNKSPLNVSPAFNSSLSCGLAESATNSAGAIVKMPNKFAADYSKPEDFDVDLQEALKRSMLDQ